MLRGHRRRRLGRASALAVALAPVAIGAATADAACGGVKHVRASRDLTPGPPPLAIGDSVMLGALEEVARAGFEIDTRGCRQMGEGLGVLRARRRAGRLPPFVAMALGTNLSITAAQIRAALRIVGRRRVLGLVTPREDGGGSGSDARVVREAGAATRVACSCSTGWHTAPVVAAGSGTTGSTSARRASRGSAVC